MPLGLKVLGRFGRAMIRKSGELPVLESPLLPASDGEEAVQIFPCEFFHAKVLGHHQSSSCRLEDFFIMLRQSTTRPVRMLILGLTGQCNFACVYCYAHEHPQERMSFATARQAIDLAAVGGKPFVLQLSGGEPLLAFDVIEEIAAYVKQKKLPAIMQIQTNASLIDRAKAIFLRDRQIGVGISLDGRPNQNDALRKLPDGSGTSRLILAGAATLASVGVETGITCVVADSNVRQLSGIVEIAYYLGNVRKIGFDLLRAQGRGAGVKAAAAADLQVALEQVLVTAAKLECQTGRALIFAHRERVESLCTQCSGGFAHCHAMNGEAAFVNAVGEIYACASLSGFPAFRLGHVDTGIDPELVQAISEMIRGSMAFCPVCDSFSLCGGGCFARWYGAGCASEPYPPECTLKQVFIREHRLRQDKTQVFK